MSIYDVFSGGSKPYDKAEWAAQKQAQRQEAYELIDNTCSEMMVNGESFRQYLEAQGKFDRYTVNNAILVSAQMPEATQLKDKASWKQNRVYVNKDAQKIVILEPSKEYTRDDGTKAVGYNAKVVYDISETSAKDRQQAQEPKTMRELVSAMIDASPVPFVPVADLEIPAYYDSKQQTIFIKTGLTEEQLFVSMAKEVSAAVFDFKHNESRDASDFKSFCVAYVAMGATWLSTILPSAGIGMQNNFLSQLADFNYLNIGGMSFWTPHVILISAGIELFVFTFLAIHSYCRHQVA